MKKLFFLTINLLLLILQQATAQNGRADFKAELYEIDCENMTMSVDISIKASDANSTFSLAEQNYRMSFSRSIYNPVILEEFLSGIVPVNDTFAVYNYHTLEGSIDTVLSYNIELIDGTGILLNENEWVPIGRLGFNIADIDGCLNLLFIETGVFPETIITEMYEGGLFVIENGSYTELDCFNSCAALPIVENDHITTPSNQIITYDVLENDDTEGNIDLSSFHLISIPPISQMTVATTANPGEISCQPAQGFVGDVAPFEYKICNIAKQCITAEVFITVTLATNTTNPYSEDDIRLFPTAAKDYINVEYPNIVSNNKTQIAITDINGHAVFQTNEWMAGNSTRRFDISTLPQGIYFLSTRIEGEWIAKKFIKI